MQTTFTLDTSGGIRTCDGDSRVYWRDLSPFMQGYIEAMFASERATDVTKADWLPDAEAVGASGACALPCDAGFSDLAPETLARIIADCEAILGLEWLSYQNTIHDGRMLWEEHQKRDLAKYNDRFPPLTVTLGDDGKVRFA